MTAKKATKKATKKAPAKAEKNVIHKPTDDELEAVADLESETLDALAHKAMDPADDQRDTSDDN